MNNLVSIIVPIYNSEKTLSKCIDSIVNQSYKNIEVILINDGSVDNSEEICLSYKKRDPRIKYFQIENQGVSRARNYGIDKSQGEYLMFVDSDDYIDLQMIEKLIYDSEKYNLSVCGFELIFLKNDVVCSKESIFPKISSISKKSQLSKFLLSLYSNKIMLSPWLKLFNSKYMIEKNIRFNEKLSFGEDSLFVQEYLLSLDGIKMKIVNEILYSYVVSRNDSLSKKFYQSRKDSVEYVFSESLNFCNILDLDDKMKSFFALNYFRGLITCIQGAIDSNLKKDEFNQFIISIFQLKYLSDALLKLNKRSVEALLYYLAFKSNIPNVVVLLSKIRKFLIDKKRRI